ncbi:MAG: SCO family protein [Acidobacteria bacterium]|nr:SCO family protein [Acidobacteriota bacterium]
MSSIRDAEPSADPRIESSAADDAQRRRTRGVVVGIVVAAALVALGGLVIGSMRDGSTASWSGTVLGEPATLPDVTLTDTDGEPFNLRDDSLGTTTILMFGYTSCPDVCPINLASLGSALEQLGPNRSSSVRVVFISVDPGRDQPEVVRSYLDQFDRDFVGLSGGPADLRAAQEGVGVERSEFGATGEDGGYEVGHASAMFVFGPDGTARIVYPFGTRQSDWTRDLPRLLDGEVPA